MKLSALVGVGIIGTMAAACGSNLENSPAATPQSTTTVTSAPASPSAGLTLDTGDPWAEPNRRQASVDTSDPWAPAPPSVKAATPAVKAAPPPAQPQPSPTENPSHL